jgi:hypothetical protein
LVFPAKSKDEKENKINFNFNLKKFFFWGGDMMPSSVVEMYGCFGGT